MKTEGWLSVVITLFIAASGIVASCGENPVVREQREKIDSLENANWKKQLEYEDLQRNLAVISSGLDSIAIEEGKLFINGDVEWRNANRQRTQQNVAFIRDLLARHRDRIEELENRLADGDANARMLKTIIASLREQLDAKEKELEQLKRDLDNNRRSIVALTEQVQKMDEEQKMRQDTIMQQQEMIQQQKETIQQQMNKLSSGYVKIGTKRTLKSLGLLSGGSKNKTAFANADLSMFEKVDIGSTLTMDLPAKAKILSPVPAGSYQFVKSQYGVTLNILDPERFWSISNFLIIQID